MTRKPAPVHPGEVLMKNLLAPAADALAQAIGVPSVQVRQLVLGQAPVTDDMAVRLAGYFGTSVQFWWNLQAQHDRWASERNTIWGAASTWWHGILKSVSDRLRLPQGAAVRWKS
jgi:addiction module HigA family antidote